MSGLDDLPATLLDVQGGVVSRRQLVAHGVEPSTVRRLLRRRELTVVHPGVYVDHTGHLTWLQRAWAAVLALEPAALTHRSALRAADGPGRVQSDDVIHLAVDRTRTPRAPAGVRLHHLAHLDEKVQWNASPPRVRIEHAVLDVAAEAPDEVAAIATLADAVQARRTTAARLLQALERRSRIARRSLLRSVLHDVAGGTCSALEHAYLDRVERAHGLPAARRQVVATSTRGPSYRDVEYPEHRTIVELDGRLFHDTARARDRDLDRDLDAAVEGRITLRLGWGQVYGRPCETAVRVARVLAARGWSRQPSACPHCIVTSWPYLGAAG